MQAYKSRARSLHLQLPLSKCHFEYLVVSLLISLIEPHLHSLDKRMLVLPVRLWFVYMLANAQFLYLLNPPLRAFRRCKHLPQRAFRGRICTTPCNDFMPLTSCLCWRGRGNNQSLIDGQRPSRILTGLAARFCVRTFSGHDGWACGARK